MAPATVPLLSGRTASFVGGKNTTRVGGNDASSHHRQRVLLWRVGGNVVHALSVGVGAHKECQRGRMCECETESLRIDERSRDVRLADSSSFSAMAVSRSDCLAESDTLVA
jgi:hypothetical protein